jgi:hypothetical protein
VPARSARRSSVGDLRLASGDLVLLFEEPTLLFETAFGELRLASGEHGRPDGTDAGGDATQGNDEGQDRVHAREEPPWSSPESQHEPTGNRGQAALFTGLRGETVRKRVRLGPVW